MKKVFTGIFFMVIVLILLVIFNGVALADVQIVVADPMTLIQAVELAQDGDTVYISNPIFLPSDSVLGDDDKVITIRPSDDYESADCLITTSSNTVIQNVIFEGSLYEGIEYHSVVDVRGDTMILNCVFRNIDNASAGAAVCISLGVAEVVNCEFYDNSVFYTGGHIINLSSTMIKDCHFGGGEATLGGAIHNLGSLTIENCDFENNTPDDIYSIGDLTILDDSPSWYFFDCKSLFITPVTNYNELVSLTYISIQKEENEVNDEDNITDDTDTDDATDNYGCDKDGGDAADERPDADTNDDGVADRGEAVAEDNNEGYRDTDDDLEVGNDDNNNEVVVVPPIIGEIIAPPIAKLLKTPPFIEHLPTSRSDDNTVVQSYSSVDEKKKIVAENEMLPVIEVVEDEVAVLIGDDLTSTNNTSFDLSKPFLAVVIAVGFVVGLMIAEAIYRAVEKRKHQKVGKD